MSKRPIDHQMFVDKDGYMGGVEIEMTKPNETQTEQVADKNVYFDKKLKQVVLTQRRKP